MSRSPRVPTEPRAQVNVMIRCADCLHCKVVKEVGAKDRYVLKVRCAMGHWRRRKADPREATFDLCNLLAREMRKCPEYQSLSDDAADRECYLQGLKKGLPLERYVYEPDGSVVDPLEARR